MFAFFFSSYVAAQDVGDVVPQQEIVLSQEIEVVEPESAFVSIDDPEYPQFRQQIASYIPDGSFCALFVNRMLKSRYDIPVFGDAWTMQLHRNHTQWLDLLWKVSEDEFQRSNALRLYKKEDRIKHYQDLYRVLDQQADPQGVIGMVYYFSFYKSEIAAMNPAKALAQTHVLYLAGRTKFSFTNASEGPRTLEEILTENYGTIHPYERDYVNALVRLDTILEPGDQYFYHDYLVEEFYKGVKHGSLLEVFLRKHRNNRITPLLRPNSYSQITDSLREEVGAWN